MGCPYTGNQPVIEYVTQLDEFQMKCHVVKDNAMTLSRFREGLKDDLRIVTTLDHAYSLVQDYELIIGTSYDNHGGNCSSINPASTLLSKSLLEPSPSIPPIWETKGKGFEVPKNFSYLQCFNYKGFDHIFSNCHSRVLVIEEHEDVVDRPLEVQVYELQFEESDDLGDNEDTFLCCIWTFPLGLDSGPFASDTS